MKSAKLFLVLGIIAVAIGVSMFIAGAALAILGYRFVGDILMGTSSIFGVAALAFLILRLVMMAKNPDQFPEYKPQPKVVVKVVDVKEVKKSNEEKLYEQYEDLYKRNLITKEELDQKRQELLGK